MAYSNAVKAEALVRLAATGNDYDGVAKEMGIGRRTLVRWSMASVKNGAEMASKKGAISVIDLVAAALEKVLAAVPDDLPGVAWATTVGILVDKWLVLQGLNQPAAEWQAFAMRVRGLGDEQYWRVLREAERLFGDIVAGVGDEGDGTGR